MIYSEKHIDDHKKQLTQENKKELLTHCNSWNIEPVICAWYDDKEDFYTDWVDEVGYSKVEANRIFKNNPDEFKTFSDGKIVRLVK